MRIHRRTWLAFLFLTACFCQPVYAVDTDRDQLDDDKEASWGTDINNPDSDGDGFLDGEEVENRTQPMDATSYPNLVGTGEITLFTPAFSVLNNAAPSTSGVEQTLFTPAFSVLNNAAPSTSGVEQTLFTPAFSVLNNAIPYYSGVEYSIYSPTFALINGQLDCSQTGLPPYLTSLRLFDLNGEPYAGYAEYTDTAQVGVAVTTSCGADSLLVSTDDFQTSESIPYSATFTYTFTDDTDGYKKLWVKAVKDGEESTSVVDGIWLRKPESLSLDLAESTPGWILLTGEVDEWCFIGRGGTVVTAVVNPMAPTEPYLGQARVNLVGPDGSALGSAESGSWGAKAVLANVTLPMDGVYRAQVGADTANPNATGNYTLTIYNVTPNSYALILNQEHHALMTSPYAMDLWTFSAPAGTQIRLDHVNASGAGVSYQLTGPSSWSGFSGLTDDSELINLPETGTYTLQVTSPSGASGVGYAFVMRQTSITDLALGVPYYGQLGGTGFAQLFHVNLPEASPLSLKLDDASEGNVNTLYAQHGSSPTRSEFSYQAQGSSADKSILIPMATVGDWYILLYSDDCISAGSFTMTADGGKLHVTGVSPDKQGSTQAAELIITGAGFSQDCVVTLDQGATSYSPTEQNYISLERLDAVFDLTTLPAGAYQVHVARGEDSDEVSFEVLEGGKANLVTNLVVPGWVRYNTSSTIYVEYQNTGEITMPAPLLELSAVQNDRQGAWLTLSSDRLAQGFWTSATPDGFSHSVQFLASGENPGMLQPGESGRVPVYYVGWEEPWDFSYPPINFELSVLVADSTAEIEWSALKDDMRPDDISEEAWEPVYANFIAQTGSTWGDYVKMLDDNARYLHRLDERVTDIRDLLSFEVMQARGLSITNTLASEVDALMQAPGPSLSFSRSFSTDVPQHFEKGRLGYGWSDNWDRSVVIEDDGTVILHGPGGSRRTYKPDSRDESYFAPSGDYSTLTALSGGAFSLQESGGTIYAYRSDGKLNYVSDTHGNKIICTYSGDLLTRLTHSAGPYLQLTYSGDLLTSISDSVGLTTTFTYDDEHLQSSTNYQGLTNAYTYVTGEGGASEHALTAITHTDGTVSNYEYDTQGRLTKKSGCCGSPEQTLYAYDSAGRITSTDALNNSSQYYYDHRGILVRTEDPLGHVVHRSFNSEGQLVQVTDPAGRSQTYGYDESGNRISETDALGYSTHFTYTPELNRLAKLTDANGNKTSYVYEADGDLASITYADGSHENWTYDSQGNRITWTNRRGQTIHYTNDSEGRLIYRLYPDGVTHTFNYSTNGNLAGYTDPLGSTIQEYDSNDRLIKITYPGNHWLAYTYDDAGRRTSMTNELGNKSNYQYDSMGRLERLTDENGVELVVYTYDSLGQMTLKTLGNGVYSTYTYDSAGQLLDLFNHKPDGSVLSRFQYTYDNRGRRDSMTTTYGNGDSRTNLAGTWKYDYDDIGQLIGWTAPWGKRVEYNYDALGNRIIVNYNGKVINYSINNLNLYTQVGNNKYQYDSDGNMTKIITIEGDTSFNWSVDNRLISSTGVNGILSYFYDARGYRRRATSSMNNTDFIFDSVGFDNVVSEFINDSFSNGIHYYYGNGLLSFINQSSGMMFFVDDDMGNVSELLDIQSNMKNNYSFDPYGELIDKGESFFNRFKYIGEYGVSHEEYELYLMGSRYYSSILGRFVSIDRIKIDGNDINMTRYVKNRPLYFIDPYGYSAQTKGPGQKKWICPNYPNGIMSQEEAEKDKRCNDHNANLCLNALPGDSNLCDCVHNYNSTKCSSDMTIYAPEECLGPTPPSTCNMPADNKGNKANKLGSSNGLNDCGNGGDSSSQPVGSSDPNEKIGPKGYGSSGFLTTNQVFPYTIHFENESSAMAPAQMVTITDPLDTDLDVTTVELTGVGFGDHYITIPTGTQHFETTESITYNNTTFNVEIEAGIHPKSGNTPAEIYVHFTSIDPNTSLPPSVDVGFLPPEDGTGRGMGYFNYTVKPKADLATGTEIRNVAWIVFDGQNSIATNQVDPHDATQGTDPDMECLNTIDSGAPESQVNALPAQSTSPFLVSWTGQDDNSGSGIASYDIYMSDNGGSYQIWLQGITQTSAKFTGKVGHTYRFYCIATDNVGHVEEKSPITAEATTFTTSGPTPTKTLKPTRTRIPTRTRTFTRTRTQTPTVTLSPTFTPTRTLSPTITPTPTRTRTSTKTRTITRTPTLTLTVTPTLSQTFTRTCTPTLSPSSTRTWTGTPTPKPTVTNTATPTPSMTRTPFPTKTPTRTPSTTAPDRDGDGVADSIEAKGGDGNLDGLMDMTQYNVASFIPSTHSRFLTLAAPPWYFLKDVKPLGLESIGETVDGVSFPLGLFHFAVKCPSKGAEVSLTLYLPMGTSVTGFMNYGPTLESPEPHLYSFLRTDGQGAVIGSKTITLYLKDGGWGDNGQSVDGWIELLCGPARPVVDKDKDNQIDIMIPSNALRDGSSSVGEYENYR